MSPWTRVNSHAKYYNETVNILKLISVQCLKETDYSSIINYKSVFYSNGSNNIDNNPE